MWKNETLKSADIRKLVVDFFQDDEKRVEIIRLKLFDVVDQVVKVPIKKNRKMKITPIRKHYNYLLNIYQSYKTKTKEEELKERDKLRLSMAKVYSKYDEARENINALFSVFISSLVDEILKRPTSNNLKRGKTLFEAFYGYAKYCIEVKNKKGE